MVLISYTFTCPFGMATDGDHVKLSSREVATLRFDDVCRLNHYFAGVVFCCLSSKNGGKYWFSNSSFLEALSHLQTFSSKLFEQSLSWEQTCSQQMFLHKIKVFSLNVLMRTKCSHSMFSWNQMFSYYILFWLSRLRKVLPSAKLPFCSKQVLQTQCEVSLLFLKNYFLLKLFLEDIF